MNIPLAKPEILESDIAAVAAVLRSSHLSQGPVLRAFEEALASYLKVDHVVAINSGTSALQLALLALRIGDGDEVILPSFSFMAVTNAVLAVRAIPVYADIDPRTLNLDAAKVEPLISPKTKAIIAVHTFGHPAQMDQISALAGLHGLKVIEDACEALGAETNRRKAGTLGDAGILAFYPNKQITAGEGGALITNSRPLADLVRSLSNQGRNSSMHWFQHENAGYSYRLSDINCALGLQQLSRIDDILNKREILAGWYRDLLQDDNNNKDVKCYRDYPNVKISWFAFPVLLPEGVRQRDRDEIWRQLKKSGIECGRYFPPAHLQPVVRKFPFRCGDLSTTVDLAQRLLCLPFFHSLEHDSIRFICKSLSAALDEQIGLTQLQNVVGE